MHKHIKCCWGAEALEAAMALKDVTSICENVIESLNKTGKVGTAFAQQGKGRVTYSNLPHTKTETRYVNGQKNGG